MSESERWHIAEYGWLTAEVVQRTICRCVDGQHLAEFLVAIVTSPDQPNPAYLICGLHNERAGMEAVCSECSTSSWVQGWSSNWHDSDLCNYPSMHDGNCRVCGHCCMQKLKSWWIERGQAFAAERERAEKAVEYGNRMGRLAFRVHPDDDGENGETWQQFATDTDMLRIQAERDLQAERGKVTLAGEMREAQKWTTPPEWMQDWCARYDALTSTTESRSVQRRVAAQRGEPAPDFTPTTEGK